MKIIWTNFALDSLKNIFNFYKDHVNNIVANNIKKEILKTTNKLKKHPNIGQKEINLEHLGLNHRYIVSNNYKIIYRILDKEILINDVFDTRQDPIKMRKRNV